MGNLQVSGGRGTFDGDTGSGLGGFSKKLTNILFNTLFVFYMWKCLMYVES